MNVGILGGGQLARMIILDGLRLGLSFRVFDEKLHSATKDIVDCHEGSFLDEQALKKFAEGLDVVTCEFENIPAKTIEILTNYVPCFPCAEAFSAAQDRLIEKDMLCSLGIETTQYHSITSADDIEKIAKSFSFPLIIKSSRLGYDGKGQRTVKEAPKLAEAWDELGNCDAIAEAFVNYDRELSIVGVFGRGGETAHYPLVENDHENGILVSTLAPAAVNDELTQMAKTIVDKIAKHYGYVGVLVVEFFQVGDKLLVNEIAPRVHNSGHWTIEGAVCSQFENNLRAVCGFPLGSTEVKFTTISYNILSKLPKLSQVLEGEGAYLHLYDKSEKDLRKIGHITYCNHQNDSLDSFLENVASTRKNS